MYPFNTDCPLIDRSCVDGFLALKCKNCPKSEKKRGDSMFTVADVLSILKVHASIRIQDAGTKLIEIATGADRVSAYLLNCNVRKVIQRNEERHGEKQCFIDITLCDYISEYQGTPIKSE